MLNETNDDDDPMNRLASHVSMLGDPCGTPPARGDDQCWYLAGSAWLSCRVVMTGHEELKSWRKSWGFGADIDIERKNDTDLDCCGLRERRVFLATPVKHPTPALSFATTRTYPRPGGVPQTILMIPNTG
jgi:hypothetical protein